MDNSNPIDNVKQIREMLFTDPYKLQVYKKYLEGIKTETVVDQEVDEVFISYLYRLLSISKRTP